jgi:hypothetical protein
MLALTFTVLCPSHPCISLVEAVLKTRELGELVCVNVAVTTLLPLIVNVAGLAVPVRSPLQPVKVEPVVGIAVRVMAVSTA